MDFTYVKDGQIVLDHNHIVILSQEGSDDPGSCESLLDI